MAAVAMVLGLAIISVPTGIVASAMSRSDRRRVGAQVGPESASGGHDHGAKDCGSPL